MTPAAAHAPRGSGRPGATEQVTIERVVAGGDGLARGADGRVVFVPGGLPGEVVDVRLVSAKRDFARGSLQSVLTPHPSRVTPPCPVLHRGCGGCDWQHADAGLQLQMKVEVVREALHRTGRIADPQVVAAGAVEPWAYRTTMRFALDRTGRASLRRARSNDLVPVDACLVAHPRIDDLLADLRLPGADEVTIRASAATGERTAWWTPEHVRPVGLPADVAVGVEAHLTEEVLGTRLRVTAGAFFQSGPSAAAMLVEAVGAACGSDLGAATRVIDAYGGVGLFACTLVPDGTEVVVVEGSAAACADARHNLAGRSARVDHVAMEDWVPEPADVVIADPSRQGLGRDAVERLAGTGASVLVLVSCDPVALARDVTLLREAGYDPGPTAVLDLFPQTHHVEAVTRFERRHGAPAGG